jgi:hypothetical protein
MTVVERAPELYEVSSSSGRAYTVDVEAPACTCPDFEYNLPTEDGMETCKHIRRVLAARGDLVVPARALDVDAIDPLLGTAIDGVTQVAVATDGAGAGKVIDEDPKGGDRPGDGECWASSRHELPCFPCYREGFETPNPLVQDGDHDA